MIDRRPGSSDTGSPTCQRENARLGVIDDVQKLESAAASDAGIETEVTLGARTAAQDHTVTRRI